MRGRHRQGRLCSVVCAIAAGGALALPGLAAAAPAVSGADGDAWSTAPSYLVTPEEGTLSVSWGTTNQQTRVAGADPFTITVSGALTEGEHSLTVTQRQRGSVETRTVRRFVIDRTAPPAVRVLGPSAVTSATAFGVSWTGQEDGARFSWSAVAGDGGDNAAPIVQGPTETTATQAEIAGLSAGAYAVRVVQIDRAGNVSPPAALPVTVIPAPTLAPTARPPSPAPAPAPRSPSTPPVVTPAATVTKLVLPSLRTSLLRPRKAAVVRSRRPVLSWTRGPRGTTVYNVQIFRVGTPSAAAASDAVPLRKVRSVFPRAQRLRTPLLARGACYVWRVWPFRGKKFTKQPLGVSNFCVSRTARVR